MKYDKQKHVRFLQYNLLYTLFSIGLDESKLDTITPEEMLNQIHQTYPGLR